MKTIRSVFITLAAVLGLAALAACVQPVTPADYPGGTTGRVILTVSAGEPGAARTILPTTVPVFSRYELDFTKDVTTISAPDTSGITGAGVSQELTAGTWTVTVRAYRTFTLSGGPEDEYLAAEGSGPVTVAGGAVTEVTVSLEPVQRAGEPGIFTYTVTFPPLVTAASLTLTGGTTITETPLSGQTVSIALDPGYYDLVISLANGDGTLTAGVSEKVHIYSGLESAAAYTFTEADFAQTIPLAGTVTLDGGAVITAGTIQVYDPGNTVVGSASVPPGGTAWAVGVGVDHAGQTLSFKLEALGSNGNMYEATGSTGGPVTVTGMRGITLSSVTTITPALLALNVPTDGTISPGEVDWYTFTASGVDYYHLQWEAYPFNGKTLNGRVSAYRSNGTPVFIGQDMDYTRLRLIGVSPGETVYVRVEGQSSSATGTYAIRYFQSEAGTPPESAPSDIHVRGNPASAAVIFWIRDFNATGYRVYRAAASGGPYSPVGTAGSGDVVGYWSFFTDTTVSAGDSYYYKVSVLNAAGEGPLSSAVSDTIPVPAPGTGAALTVNAWRDGDISVTGEVDWYRITAAGTYHIQWADLGALYYGGPVKTLLSAVSAFRSDGTPVFLNQPEGFNSPEEAGVRAGETLYVRVENYRDMPTTTGTYAVRYYDPAALPPQAVPSPVYVQGTPAPAAVVSWTSPFFNSMDGTMESIPVTEYHVYRAATIDGDYGLYPVGTVNDEGDTYRTYSFTDTTVPAGATYFYTVCAVNAHGEGPRFPPVSDKAPVPATGTGTLLTGNQWKNGDISTYVEVDWYKFTAGLAGTYHLQWDDRFNSGGSKTAYVEVSAYRSDGTPVFIYERIGFDDPKEVVVSAGETIHVRVETSQGGSNGTYAIKYYQ